MQQRAVAADLQQVLERPLDLAILGFELQLASTGINACGVADNSYT
jgi:hypothetical protein